MTTRIPISWQQFDLVDVPDMAHPHRGGRREELRTMIRLMKPGSRMSFTIGPDEHQTVYLAASGVGARITARKLDGDGYRVWRVA